MISMDAKTRARLDEAARLMVEEAQAAGNDRIFSATGFARERISIVHQQVRCTNLAWALGHTQKIGAATSCQSSAGRSRVSCWTWWQSTTRLRTTR
jgi:hypothetical protein